MEMEIGKSEVFLRLSERLICANPVHLLNRLCWLCSEEEVRWRLSGRRPLCLREDAADRWIYFVLFDVPHVDRPADEAAQPGAQTLEPIDTVPPTALWVGIEHCDGCVSGGLTCVNGTCSLPH